MDDDLQDDIGPEEPDKGRSIRVYDMGETHTYSGCTMKDFAALVSAMKYGTVFEMTHSSGSRSVINGKLVTNIYMYPEK